MKKWLYIFFLALLAGSCQKDKDFLTRTPTDLLEYEAVWSDQRLVLAAVADLYDRLPEYQQLESWANFAMFDEAFASNFGDYNKHKNQDYGYQEWAYWEDGYALIRDANLFIKIGTETDQMESNENEVNLKNRFLAEARFVRASVYFEMVKRMGGVPLVLEPLEYDYSGDPSYLQQARAKEHEIYDFVIAELEELREYLPNDAATKSRATQAAASALEARAALYAGSIAKHGVNTPQVSLVGGEVGIPNSMANAYYQKALTAAEEIINSGTYSLYERNAQDLSANFSSLFLDKSANPEVIFVKDYKIQSGKVHGFTLSNQPRSLSEEVEGGRINPSLNLVQSFELLDNTYAPLPLKSGANDVYYDDPQDLFANRDARLAGTVMVPGSTFKGEGVDIWAGYLLGNGNIVTAAAPGGRGRLPGKNEDEQVVGFDGPIDGFEWTAQTGFYLRKYLDPTPGAGQIGTQSEVWWIRYRYGEVLLNAAEAAFELGQIAKAADYMNQVRRRAGFIRDLNAGEINFDRIVHERKVELAFEGHQLWDMKRWRLAHQVWNGTNHPLTTANIGKAGEPSTRPFGIWPYKIYDPGNANDGKWVFKQIIPREVTNPDRFRLGNYYSFISDNIRNRNPKIVRNPNQ